MVLLLPLGMANGDDYAGDSLLVYGYSTGERLCLRITLRGNNSVARGDALREDFADLGKINSTGG